MMNADMINRLLELLEHADRFMGNSAVKAFAALVSFGKQSCLRDMQSLTFEQRILEKG